MLRQVIASELNSNGEPSMCHSVWSEELKGNACDYLSYQVFDSSYIELGNELVNALSQELKLV
jgi:hypothetical protein